MEMAINKTGHQHAPGKSYEMSSRTNERLQVVEAPVRGYPTIGNRDRIAPAAAKDRSAMQNEISLIQSAQRARARLLEYSNPSSCPFSPGRLARGESRAI